MLLADRSKYLKYDATLGSLTVGVTPLINIIQNVSQVVFDIRLLRFEAKICLILFHDKATHPLKALNRAEKEFSVTKKLPEGSVFAPLWKRCEALKRAAPA
jgi:hypothetical protein